MSDHGLAPRFQLNFSEAFYMADLISRTGIAVVVIDLKSELVT